MKNNSKFKVGETVEYKSFDYIIRPQILRVKEDGKYILNTAEKEHKILNAKKGINHSKTLKLSKNVCVMPHRIKKMI